VTLKLRYADFQTLTRSRTLPRPTNEERRVFATCRRLLAEAWTRRRPLRLIGVALSHLSGPSRQLDLFAGPSEARPVGRAVDTVRARFGYDAIRLGATGRTRWLEQRTAHTDSIGMKGRGRPPEDPDIG
jgi:DNA polymerase-4